METKINILSSFFEDPKKGFHIRELARILKINHTTIRKYLNIFVKRDLLVLEKDDLYPSYKLVLSRETLNLKAYYNLEKLRKSGLIKELEKEYDFPIIVLFGSYSQAMDDLDSDIDICLISDINKELKIENYEKILNRKLNIHKFTKKAWENLKDKNSGLVNSICNGIVLSGELEVL